MIKKVLLVFAAGAALLGATACSEIAEPNQVGLWYAQGQIDGNKFDHCVKPSSVDDTSWNDSVYWVTNSLRTWNQSPEGGDTKNPLTVTAKPDAGQTSGLEVNVWTTTNFMLNTFCGTDEKDANSPLVQWWEKLGKRYSADTDAGWATMLNNTIVPALEKAKNELRNFSADELVLGTKTKEAQDAFAKTFSSELERLSGGKFFCGPSFNRSNGECPAVEVSIKDVDYRDPGVQAARNDKQKAIEAAAAKVAEAQGQVAAANAQRELYNNPAWVALQKAQIQLQIAQACGQNPNCHMVMGADGTIITTG